MQKSVCRPPTGSTRTLVSIDILIGLSQLSDLVTLKNGCIFSGCSAKIHGEVNPQNDHKNSFFCPQASKRWLKMYLVRTTFHRARLFFSTSLFDPPAIFKVSHERMNAKKKTDWLLSSLWSILSDNCRKQPHLGFCFITERILGHFHSQMSWKSGH